MSDLTIYGNILSQPVRSVVEFCKLSNIQYTHKDLHPMKGEHLTEEYSKINPFQEIPAIVHDGYNVWESAAIVPYLADSYNVDNQWYPKDIKIRARINAYLHWHHQGVRAVITNYIRQKIAGPKFFGAPELTPETEAPLRAKLNEWFETFTWMLSETHYAARTQTATVADLFAFNEIECIYLLQVDISAYPAIKTWYDEIAAIPAVHEATAAAQEIIKAMMSS
ncbi:hypothetical protein SteCoe_37466 [Stentor coeruleus]|uniref:GST N-terminal domain-containing protein n=1 Tax=Stentor coeruleus TaxID=5963 RepID=A0A1R2AN20_9CILI|nr:hypothetical protein SteCoe_37466 [Stentor coeruleus]